MNPSTRPRRCRYREQLILILLVSIVSLEVVPYLTLRFLLVPAPPTFHSLGLFALSDKDNPTSFHVKNSASWKLDTTSVAEEPSSTLSCAAPADTAGVFLSQQEVKQVITELTEVENKTQRLVPIAVALLKRAQSLNSTLLTIQVGGMDGKTGDPMHRVTTFFDSLVNWMPVVLEPVGFNFQNLQATYKGHQEKKQLPCPLLLHQAISYDGNTTCPFCHYDKIKQECEDAPDWQKYEIGSLDCGFFEAKFQNCYVQDNLHCDTIVNTVKKWSLPAESIAILQIDVEGYETNLLRGLLSEIDGWLLAAVVQCLLGASSKSLYQRVQQPNHEFDFSAMSDPVGGLHEKALFMMHLGFQPEPSRICMSLWMVSHPGWMMYP